MTRITTTAAAVIAAAALAACGGSTASHSTTTHHTTTQSQNQQAISSASASEATAGEVNVALATLPHDTTDPSGNVEWLAPGEPAADLSVDAGCSATEILIGAADVSADKGDPELVTNPAGTVGVKVDGTQQFEAQCLQQAADALKQVQ